MLWLLLMGVNEQGLKEQANPARASERQTGSNRNWRISDTSRPETSYQLWSGCDKSSRQLFKAPRVALGAVKLQSATSGCRLSRQRPRVLLTGAEPETPIGSAELTA
jgi:hypothetical protein